MDKILIISLALFMLFIASFSFASIIPQDRAIDWSNCGLPSGILAASKAIDVKKDFGALGDGINDDYAAIIRAIDSCTGPCVIKFPEGTYLIKKPINVSKDWITLEGAGSGQTKLVFDLNGTNFSCLTFEKNQTDEFIPVKAGAIKGSTEILLNVTSTAGIVKGMFSEILQDNDRTVMYSKAEWEQVWAKNCVGQIVKILDVNGNKVTLENPLNMTYKKELNPRLRKVDLISGCGVNSLYITRRDAGDGNMITLKYAAYALIKHIESDMVMRSHISAEASFRCEVRDSYFHHAFDYGGGGHGYGVELKMHTTGCLVENNRFFHLRHSMMVHLGANGNVFGYNYSGESFANGDHDPKKAVCDISVHGHYPYMNLFESNTVQKIEVSDWWGPCGPNTFLRNRIEKEGIIVADRSNGQIFAGNIIKQGDYGIEIMPGVDSATIFDHGNSEYGEMTWDKSVSSQAIPVSLYLKKKPDFIKNSLWPIIGPDCGSKLKIPAEKRMEK